MKSTVHPNGHKLKIHINNIIYFKHVLIIHIISEVHEDSEK